MTQPPERPTGLPREEEGLRRLLADARHDDPTPPEVVAHLDATLAALAAERGTTPATATSPPAAGAPAAVVDLGARRRRVAGLGLLAAAAVVVAGVAIGQNLPSMSSDDAGSAADGDTTSSQLDSDDSSAGGAEREEVGPGNLKSGAPAPLASYPTLSSDDSALDQDLLSLRADAVAFRAPGSPATEPRAACDLRGTGPGRRVLAEVDGFAGAVVFRRADGATQQVDLYLCGDPAAVRTLTLPAP